ncbi:MAG TPA: transketolase C-terminal domain-containing protein [Actinophytocola sp.]|uniref:transketolase family protein n=1 Tax=Actinophytocola sp. TaxID=1872138 RepID=UPI002DDD613E|nr:transketolase C-terminal domain-containing protein [Actinophytocola sp.]HEV2780533.1 transketolase C-terminal domain-containing protein [Actinophytocola sp.]
MSTDIATRRSVAEVYDHVWENRSTIQSRDAYAMMLLALARENPLLACLTTDMNFQDHFARELPRQFVDLGIAEQNMITVAAGMTVAARPVFANGMSPFAIARAYEQIKVDVAGANLPVKIVGTHGGLASGHYGPTHHSLEDIGATRLLPNMTVVVPGDAWEAVQATVAVADDPGPTFLRLGRSATPTLYDERTEFVLGKARVLREPGRVLFIATGPYPNLVAAEAAAELAATGITAGHLNMHTVKPLDREAILDAIAHAEVVVTIEDHRAVGGLGGAVCEVVAEVGGPPVRRIGIPDVHYDLVGGERYLLDNAGINVPNAIAKALDVVAR